MAKEITTEARGSTIREVDSGRGGSRGRSAVLGTLMIIVGISAVLVPRVAGLKAVFFLGIALAVSGLIEVFGGGSDSRAEHRGVLVGGGLLSLTVGLLLMLRPMAGMAAITFLLVGLFFASGLSALVTAAVERYAGWGWDFAFGAASLLLGVVALAAWPRLAVWLVGTLVGIEIVIRGATMLSTGMERHGLLRAPRRQTA